LLSPEGSQGGYQSIIERQRTATSLGLGFIFHHADAIDLDGALRIVHALARR
jgi:hypothetical protein